MRVLLLPILWGCAYTPLLAQTPGRNVNMVSGTIWPGGDPYLQRQNEPSVAASTRNPMHLLAGANDYRTVDLPGLPDSRTTGDAWLGVFKSFDGGLTWKSTLMPGCPQNVPECGGAPELKGYEAAADPVVRAGTNGLFYYSGIVFDRNHNRSRVFTARFIDHNNKENGDTIQFLGASVIHIGDNQRFVDKPWIATDIPRAGALTCAAGSQSFPGGNVYIAYSAFSLPAETLASIQFSRSRDCGITWSTPTPLSTGAFSDQGATVGVEPLSGDVYVAWRRFDLAAGAGIVLVARSVDGGQTFGTPVIVSSFSPFDQPTSEYGIRTNAYPSLAFDGAGRIYVAWSQRGVGPGGDARIVMVTSADGASWSTPLVPDPSSRRGHQLMPALGFAGGKLMLVYYDLREDQTIGYLECPLGHVCDTTDDRIEVRRVVGDLALGHVDKVFNPAIVDTAPGGRVWRHTLDVRAAQASPGPVPAFSSSVRVSEYLYGSSTAALGAKPILQLRFNVPNLPLFALGTVPFLGDYIDISPASQFVTVQIGTRTVWRYGTGSGNDSLFHAVWTDNRDVRPPPDADWTTYTPAKPQGPSLVDASKTTPACAQDRTGMRDQNVYTARIAAGVVAGSPANAKDLSAVLQRAFVISVQNTASVAKTYRLGIPPASQPPGGRASFHEASLITSLDVTIPSRSTTYRTVFVMSAQPKARLTVDVAEISGPGGVPVPPAPGTRTVVTLNPDLTNPDLTNPDLTNPGQTSQPVTNSELYNPDLTNPDLTNPDLTNPDLTNPDLTNPDLTNPDLTNPDLTNTGRPNPDLTNAQVMNPDLTNPDLTNPDLTNGTITDTIWKITNQGNTTAAYNLKLLLRNQIPPGVQLQLALYKVYTTPAVVNCQVTEKPRNVLLANIPNPAFVTDANRAGLGTPDLTNPSPSNAMLALAPGETARIVLRTYLPVKNVEYFNPARSVTVVAVAQALNTNESRPRVDASNLVIVNGPLSDAIRNLSWGDVIPLAGTAVGATTWTVIAGALPPGVSLDPSSGTLSGLPSLAGSFTFTVRVTDSAPVPNTDVAQITVRVADPLIIENTSLPAGRIGQPYSQTLTATGGIAPLSWSVVSQNLPPGLTVNPATGVISGIPTALGSFLLQLRATDSSSPRQSHTRVLPLVIGD